MFESTFNNTLKFSFIIDFTTLMKFPDETTLDEIEKYILSKFVIEDKVKNELNLISAKDPSVHLTTNEKKTAIIYLVQNEFNIDLTKLFEGMFKTDYTKEQDTVKTTVPFFPSFNLKVEEDFFLGSTFNDIYKCYYNNQIYAIKFLNVNDNIDSLTKINSIDKEIQTYSKLFHRGVPRFQGETYFTYKSKGYLMDFIEGEKLVKKVYRLDEIKKFDCLYQLVDVILYLHENLIIHRNIKPDTLLLKENNDLLLVDYGLSKLANITSDESEFLSIVNQEINSVYCFKRPDMNDFNTDYWSFGCIAYFIFTHKHPFDNNYRNLQIHFEKTLNFFNKEELKSNPLVYEIVSSCCDFNTIKNVNLNEIKIKLYQHLEKLRNRKINDDSTQNKFLRELNKQLDISVKNTGENHLSTAEYFIKIANEYKKISNHQFALDYFRKALNIQLFLLGKNNLDTASSYFNIAVQLKLLEQPDNSIKYLIKCLKIRGDLLKEDLLVAEVYEEIANIYCLKEIYDPSLLYLNKSLEIKRKLTLLDNLEIANTYHQIGHVYFSKKDNEKAIENYSKSLEIKNKCVGYFSIEVTTTLEMLSLAYWSIGEFSKAIECLEKSLNIKLRKLGENNIEISDLYYKIANVFSAQKDYTKALEFYEKSLKIRIDLLGEDNLYVANSFNNIGSIYRKNKQYEKTLEFYNKALKIRSELLGLNHNDTADSYYNIGLIYFYLGIYEKAIDNYKKSLNICLNLKDNNSGHISNIEFNLGITYFYKGEYKKSLKHYQKSIEIRKIQSGEHDEEIANCYFNIGIVYDNQFNYSKALENYEKSLQIRMKILGESHIDTIDCLKNIACVYSSLNKPQKENEYLSKIKTKQS